MSLRTALALALLSVFPLSLPAARPEGKKDEKVVITDSGLKYVDQKVGTGKAARKGDLVEVHSTG